MKPTFHRPLPFEVVWRERDELRQITTFSRREAESVLERKRRAGKEPSLYVGNLELVA